jgi:hypothetical protein
MKQNLALQIIAFAFGTEKGPAGEESPQVVRSLHIAHKQMPTDSDPDVERRSVLGGAPPT